LRRLEAVSPCTSLRMSGTSGRPASSCSLSLLSLGLIYSRGWVDYVAITSSSGACDGASVGFQLLRDPS
jgi:hypothetical protein